MQLSLPPIELHASTQTDNRTPEKVRFLQEVGFRRVVLARELSLSEITAIHQATSVELEAFVHGALCVSYSGQCYMSAAATGRSANRGCCAQYCRLPYSLYDATGRKLAADKHLLSLKDMDRSDYLQEMIEAGVTSFKIEGRLKEVEYVKNITAYYRQRFRRYWIVKMVGRERLTAKRLSSLLPILKRHSIAARPTISCMVSAAIWPALTRRSRWASLWAK